MQLIAETNKTQLSFELLECFILFVQIKRAQPFPYEVHRCQSVLQIILLGWGGALMMSSSQNVGNIFELSGKKKNNDTQNLFKFYNQGFLHKVICC